MTTRRFLATGLAAALLLTACSTDGDGAAAPGAPATGDPTTATAPDGSDVALPALAVEVLLDDLTLPWDLAPLPDGSLLLTEKDTGAVSRYVNGERREVAAAPAGHWSSGETGLMGIAVDPNQEGRFVTCGGYSEGTPEVRVVEWQLDGDLSTATEGEPLVTGITASSGRHGGCRVLITEAGELYVATGDAAIGTLPRDLSSLNGKVLRVDAETGEAVPDNPFVDQADADPRVYSFGHRNLQGMTLGPEGAVWTAEHGPDVDDEVNQIVAGGDYGWDPVPADGGQGYDESVPMTDDELPGDQVAARWSSGERTVATADVELIEGSEWGGFEGWLAVATLKDQELLMLPLDADGQIGEVVIPEELTAYGRLRSLVQLEDGSLLVTTSNGSGDQLLRVTPAG